MSKNTHEATFTLQIRAIPASWKDFLNDLSFRHSDRETKKFPIWWRFDGRGYTIWVSEWHLTDSTSTPPTWQTKLETLASLPLAGKERWNECYAAIEKFLKETDGTYIINNEKNCDA